MAVARVSGVHCISSSLERVFEGKRFAPLVRMRSIHLPNNDGIDSYSAGATLSIKPWQLTQIGQRDVLVADPDGLTTVSCPH